MKVPLSRRRVVAAMAAALLAGGIAAWVTRPLPEGSSSTLTRIGAGTPSPAPTASTSRSAPTVPTQAAGVDQQKSPAGAPARLVVPRLHATMKVLPEGLDPKGFMALPDSPFQAGWYKYGSAASDESGAVVIAAHVDTKEAGAGPLARLDRMRPGDTVLVVTGSLTYAYRVESVLRLNKNAVDVAAVFSRSGPARLHLLTCGGPFDADTGHYEDNVIVVAERLSSP